MSLCCFVGFSHFSIFRVLYTASDETQRDLGRMEEDGGSRAGYSPESHGKLNQNSQFPVLDSNQLTSNKSYNIYTELRFSGVRIASVQPEIQTE
jgi:hypothetical protein